MTKISQFYKTILSIVLSIGFFLVLKEYLPERLFPEAVENDGSMLIDSVLLEALDGNSLVEVSLLDSAGNLKSRNGDSIVSIQDTSLLQQKGEGKQLLAKHRIRPFSQSNFSKKLERRKPFLHFPDEHTNFVVQKPIIDTLLDPTISIQGYGYLQRFFAKINNLEQGKQGRARVAYFGDSMNDGDFIVQDVRSMLQDEFGGNGVGYVSVTSMSAASRGSVHHQFSDNWFTQSFVSVRHPSKPFGVDGQVFLATGGYSHWVSYAAGNSKNSPVLYNPTLFYGLSDNQSGKVRIRTSQSETEEKELTPQYALNTLSLGASSTKTLQLNFNNIENVPIYGFNFSSYTGVHVDNFSLRGNSGLPLSGFNTALMNAFDRILNYDLIILHYGTNVLNYGSLDYSWYEQNMTAVINKLKHCFPNADILVISTADKSTKIDMKMVTDPAVISLVKAQKRFARETGSGFIDLYNLMGGNGSMVEWVNKQMANKDYTHFNIPGSREIGTLLYDELNRGYTKYKTQLEKEKVRKNRNSLE